MMALLGIWQIYKHGITHMKHTDTVLYIVQFLGDFTKWLSWIVIKEFKVLQYGDWRIEGNRTKVWIHFIYNLSVLWKNNLSVLWKNSWKLLCFPQMTPWIDNRGSQSPPVWKSWIEQHCWYSTYWATGDIRWFSWTHWGRYKMAAISQMTFWNVFSWMKMYEFRLRFHWNLLLRFELTIYQHWLQIMAWCRPSQRQAIIAGILQSAPSHCGVMISIVNIHLCFFKTFQ